MVWAVSAPKVVSQAAARALNTGNVWTRMATFRLQSARSNNDAPAEVTTLVCDAETPLVLAADQSGRLVVWCANLRDNRAVAKSSGQVSGSGAVGGSSATSMESQSVFEEILRLKLNEVVTSALLVAPLSSLR